MRTRKTSDISVGSKHSNLRDFEWHQRLTRRLEQVLNVHPEKYHAPESRSTRVSRNPTPVDGEPRENREFREKKRAHSVDLSLPPIMDVDEINGNLLHHEHKSASPQRGSPLTESCNSGDIVTINVSGLKFQTWERTLERYPESLLGNKHKRQQYYVPELGEYFFDRHRSSFEAILYIYQSEGRVKRPEIVPIDIFLKELKFFQLGEQIMEAFWESEGYEKPEDTVMPVNPTQRKLWELMEYPDSSLLARVVALISIVVIVVSIVSFCLETLPSVSESTSTTSLNSTDKVEVKTGASPLFFWIELICIIWFTFELFFRFISCPSKCHFLKQALNWLDFLAIAPFFGNLIFSDIASSTTSLAVLRVLRLVRVFRIFKLSRHSAGLQILIKTFKSSWQEFCLLIFFMGIALVLFSSFTYIAEQSDPNTKFTSIPATFWFVLVTMTTVGYGDLVPITTPGKLVGSVCSLVGVLTLALPVPIIVANFKHYYRQETRLSSMRLAVKDDDDVEIGDES